MKKSLVLAAVIALGVTASAYAANPFSDVPQGHWAYDAVSKLAAEGVVDGYPDGTYGGDRLISLNPAYRDIVLNDHDEIICFGKVIGRLKK